MKGGPSDRVGEGLPIWPAPDVTAWEEGSLPKWPAPDARLWDTDNLTEWDTDSLTEWEDVTEWETGLLP
jgi:hypothetical protein